MLSGVPRSSTASCAACSPCKAPLVMLALMAGRTDVFNRRAPRSRHAKLSPWMYSMTKKISSLSSSTTTSSGTVTLGCWIRVAKRASSRNIETNSASREQWGCRCLMATVRENPAAPTSRPIWTVAIPPDAISSYMT